MRLTARSLLVTIAVIAAPSLAPHSGPLRAAQSDRAAVSNSHRDDPCDQLPDPPGKALGIDKKCPPGGSSSGVAKGDFNGDGWADLAIGEPGATVGGFASAGDVIVIYGSANGLTTNTPGIPGRQLWYEGRVPGSPGAGNLFGSALASGDFNDDGYSDLAIGIPGKDVTYQGATYQDWGTVVVIYGSATGLSATHTSVFDFSQHFNFADGHAAPGAQLGLALAWGDFNGDGTGDLAVGAPFYTLDRGLFASTTTEAGAVWVLYGRAKDATGFGGLTTISNLLMQFHDLSSGAFFEESSDHFGAALTSGDFDSDGFFDLVIGTPDKKDQKFVFTISTLVPTTGFVHVLRGSSLGLDTNSVNGYVGSGPTFPNRYGAALAVGDFNGDSHPDLAIGAPLGGIDSRSTTVVGGVVGVIYGSSTGLPPQNFENRQFFQDWDQQTLGGSNATGDRFGAALAAGDFNGDGKFDLAIGIPLKNVGGFNDAGEVRVVYGSTSGLATTPRSPQILHGLTSIQLGAHFGASLTAWNFGRNECPGGASFCLISQVVRMADLAIGIPYQIVDGLSGAGAVQVEYGSVANNGLTGLGAAVITASSIGIGALQGAHFGATMY